MAKPMIKIRTVNDMHSTVEEIKLYIFLPSYNSDGQSL